MKKLIVFAALAMATVTAQAQQVKYTINGVSSDNGGKVYLVDELNKATLDSAVVKGGKFLMTGTAAKDAKLNIRPSNIQWQTMMFNDGTPVTVNINDSTLKGSPLNERLVHYDVQISGPYTRKVLEIAAMSEAEQRAKQNEWSAEINKIAMKMAEDLNTMFDKESNTLIPAAFFDLYCNILGPEAALKRLNDKNAYSNHPIVQKQVIELEAEMAREAKKTAYIDKQFTDLEEADVDGNMHKLSEYVGRGKWVLVDFWASWCGPCRAEMPNVVEAYEKYHAKGFDIVGLSFDNKKEPWVKAIADLKMPWVHLSDLKGWRTVASGIYEVNSIPDNLLIDPQGKIVARGLRAQGLHQKLQEIFGE